MEVVLRCQDFLSLLIGLVDSQGVSGPGREWDEDLEEGRVVVEFLHCHLHYSLFLHLIFASYSPCPHFFVGLLI